LICEIRRVAVCVLTAIEHADLTRAVWRGGRPRAFKKDIGRTAPSDRIDDDARIALAVSDRKTARRSAHRTKTYRRIVCAVGGCRTCVSRRSYQVELPGLEDGRRRPDTKRADIVGAVRRPVDDAIAIQIDGSRTCIVYLDKLVVWVSCTACLKLAYYKVWRGQKVLAGRIVICRRQKLGQRPSGKCREAN